MADVEFHDYRIEVKAKINDALIAALHEASSEVVSQTVRNTRVGTGQLKGSWIYVVDEEKFEATIGSPLENAIWEEFGTGDYALNGDGRKGGWWIKVGNGKDEIPLTTAKKYGWKSVLKDKDGNPTFVLTYGKKGTRAFFKAFTSLKSAIISLFESKMKGLN